MSPKPVPAPKLIKLLKKMGFTPIRQRGSHVILHHPDCRSTVIPVHPGEEIGRGLLAKILRDVGLTREDYMKLLKR